MRFLAAIACLLAAAAGATASAAGTPPAEQTAERTAGQTAERTAVQTAERTAERIAEPTAEPTAERTTERTTEPPAEQTTERTTEGTAERTAGQTAERIAERIAEPTAEPTTERTTEPTAKRTAKRTAERTTERTTEPTAKRTTERTAEPTAKRTAKRTAEPTAKRTAERTGDCARIVLLVDEIKQIRSFPVVLAERLGYFADEGVTVTVMNIRDDVPYFDQLLDGRIDAVMAYYHHNVVAQSQGKDIEAVVTLGVTPGIKVMIANRARARYRTPADLKGARIIAGGAGSAKTTVANWLLIAGGHAIGDYTRLPTNGREANAAALRDGTADLLVAPTPDGDWYAAQGVASVFADLTTPAGSRQAFGTLFPSNTIFMTRARVAARPDIARHLARAFVRTLQYIRSHDAEQIAAQIPVPISGKDRAAYLAVLKEEIPMFAGDGRMPADAARGEWKVLSDFEPKYRDVDVAKTYTNAFVDAALAADH